MTAMTAEEMIRETAKYLPAINDLADRETAAKVALVWQKALAMTSWKNIGEARFKEGMKDVSLASHVNSTIECALAVSRIIRKHHNVDFDEQLIIAFGLIHDADKAVEYRYDEAGDVVKTEAGEMIQHGVLTAMFAREAGFDLKMLHMLITHTPTQNMKPAVKEAQLFGYIDLCDWEMTYKYTPGSPYCPDKK